MILALDGIAAPLAKTTGEFGDDFAGQQSRNLKSLGQNEGAFFERLRLLIQVLSESQTGT